MEREVWDTSLCERPDAFPDVGPGYQRRSPVVDPEARLSPVRRIEDDRRLSVEDGVEILWDDSSVVRL